MHTDNAIWIDAKPETIFRLAVEIERWPELLPHYNWVHTYISEDGQCVSEMAARRWIFPVKWTSRQNVFPDERRITYRHVQGLTQGMDVEWRLKTEDGGTKVTILHDLAPQHWLLRNPLGSWIASEFFVRGIADRTLNYIKLVAEREMRAERETIAHGADNSFTGSA